MSEPKRVLLVEDDPGYQELAETILGGMFELTVCSSVEEAMGKLDAGQRYSLIISDINLFGMTGLEMLSRRRQAGVTESSPIVMCSSQSDPATRERVLSMGAAGFIAKPYDFEEVVALVRKLLSDADRPA